MEKELDFDEKEYVRGFNHGAILATYEAGLADELMNSGIVLDSDFASGLSHGIQQTAQEREAVRTSELEEIRGTDNTIEEEREQDEPTDSEKDEVTNRMNELDSLRDSSLDRDSDRDISS